MEPVDSFKDARGEWIWFRAAERDYKFSGRFLRRWIERKKITVRLNRVKGGAHPRQYLLKDDLDAIVAERKKARHENAVDPRWANRKEAMSDYGVSSEMLTKYSVEPFAILGRPFKTHERESFHSGQLTRQKLWWRADLEACKDRRFVVPEGMMTLEDAERLCGFHRNWILQLAKRQQIRSEKIVGATGGVTRRRLVVSRQDIESLRDEVNRQIGSREFTIGGQVYIPHAEAMKLSGASNFELGTFRNKKNPKRGDLIVHAFQAPVRLYHNIHGDKAWLYLKTDIERLHRRINNLPEPEPKNTAPTRKENTQGRALTDAENDRRNRLVVAWESAKPHFRKNGGMERWCSEQKPPMTVKTLKGYMAAINNRRKRQ
jgi:hypothetical protein